MTILSPPELQHCYVKLIRSFFEKRVGEYARAGVMTKINQKGDEDDNVFTTTADF